MNIEKKGQKCLITLLCFCSLFCFSLVSKAEGGQVGTTGKIQLYEESTPSSNTEQSISTSSSKGTLEQPKNVKPVGRVPSLGESVSKYGWLGVVLLLISGLGYLFIFHRKKGKLK